MFNYLKKKEEKKELWPLVEEANYDANYELEAK